MKALIREDAPDLYMWNWKGPEPIPREILYQAHLLTNIAGQIYPVDGVYLNRHDKVVVVLEMGDYDLTLEIDLVELVPEER
jgi:hypothetical protein